MTYEVPKGSALMRVKKYQLIITISYSRHGAGAALISHVFGEYNSLEECEEAGKESQNQHASADTYLSYTPVPVYRMN